MKCLLPKYGKAQAVFLTLLKRKPGLTLVEYLLMATLVAVTAFFAMQMSGTSLYVKCFVSNCVN